MNPDSFHFLFDVMTRNPGEAAGLFIMLIVAFAIMVAGALIRIHSLIVWATFTAVFYELSQMFPENRAHKADLLMTAGAGSAIVTVWWWWRLAPGIRRAFKRDKRANDDLPPTDD